MARPIPVTIVPGGLTDRRGRRAVLSDECNHGTAALRLDPCAFVAILLREPNAPALNRRRRRKAMFIQTEATPNPATLKFIPGRTVLDSGTLESPTAAAGRSPLAERLFDVPGVTGVFYGSDFVTVTKADGDWQHLKPAILAPSWSTICPARRCSPTAAPPAIEARDEEDEFFNEQDADTVAQIKDLIETRVRPASPMTAATSPFRGFKDASSIST